MIKEFSWNGNIEKAELIKNFLDIQIGYIYWEVNCPCCDGIHRWTPIKLIDTNVFYPKLNRSIYTKEAWKILPSPKCEGDLVTLLDIDNIYLVINPVEDIYNEITEEYNNYFQLA